WKAIREGRRVLLEGAQGAMLDVDHGTYPFVTSSTTTAGGAAVGAGIGPTEIDGVLGVVKAYTTRVGNGPLPTLAGGEIEDRLRELGGEFGATTGRPRRCGWFDAPVVRSPSWTCAAPWPRSRSRLHIAWTVRCATGCRPTSRTWIGSSRCTSACPAGSAARQRHARWLTCRQQHAPISTDSRISRRP